MNKKGQTGKDKLYRKVLLLKMPQSIEKKKLCCVTATVLKITERMILTLKHTCCTS